jgi:glycosyltransferase involved in cell wall biosynthesis
LRVETTAASLRVLFLTHTVPFPLISGERIRSFHLLRELSRRGWSPSLFALSPTGAAVDAQRALEEICEQVWIEPLPGGVGPRQARIVRDVALGRALHRDYFLEPAIASRAKKIIEDGRFDIVVFGTLYMWPYVPVPARTRAVFDSHNVEARRIEGMSSARGLDLRGITARLQRGPVQRYERQVAGQVRRVLAVSEEEKAYFDGVAPGRTDLVANGVDTALLQSRTELPSAPEALFVGSLDYGANVDAVQYLVREIIQHVRSPGARLTVVGSNPRPQIASLAEGSGVRLELTGQVPTTRPYFERARALVVPLRWAGGTRLKILEALALGVPVVSTSIGVEGLGVRDGEHVLIADTAADFGAALDRLFQDDALCSGLARRGRELVEQRYDWRLIGDALAASLARAAGDATDRTAS